MTTQKKRSDRQRVVRTVAAGMLLLWAIMVLAGCDAPDLEDLAPGVGELIEGLPTHQGGVGWIEVHFTQPSYPDDPGMHHDGLDAVVAADLALATRSIDVAAYEFDLESLGDALVDAHERGVRVRFVIDSDTVDERTVRLLDRAGIPVVEDERSAIMHNKFVVIDGEVVWTGSWNLTENGTYRNNNNAVRIELPALAENYTAEFEEMFADRSFGPNSPANAPNPRLAVRSRVDGKVVHMENYFAPEDEVGKVVAEIVGRADESIRFLAFSFTDDDLGSLLREKSDEGVQVQGVFERRGADTAYSEYGRLRLAWPPLDVLLDANPYIMHHKVFIVDGETVVLGSYNFSSNADESNDENLLVIHSAEIAALYLDEFERIYRAALAEMK